jgi:hypothetical protein
MFDTVPFVAFPHL